MTACVPGILGRPKNLRRFERGHRYQWVRYQWVMSKRFLCGDDRLILASPPLTHNVAGSLAMATTAAKSIVGDAGFSGSC
ncbi:hypothetical protein [Novipirellula maiorica]|uniref:hypothetical protein n=1 Tax=Novipirellula maiorica TaxID=1265734 RepID=UPI001181C55A|nr:hypothetical protein [Rhodopirellula maiorica]